MKRYLAIGLAAASICGCSTSSEQSPRSIGANAPPAHAVFATEIAGPDTYLPPMPTAVVILKPDDMQRNRAFCAALAKLPTSQEVTSRSVVASNLILTRWLTQLSDMPGDRVRDCEYLTGTYDYKRAAALIASLKTDTPMAGNGPFLVMMIPDNAGLRVVGVDGSNYRPGDFDTFVASWKAATDRTQAQLSTRPAQPGLVRSIFDLAFAVVRTVFGGAAGFIQGTVAGL